MSFNFKDNLTIDNGKYLKWTNTNGSVRYNLLGLIDDNFNINAPTSGSLKLNTSQLYVNNTGGGVYSASKIIIGNSVSNNNIQNNYILLPNNSYISTNSTNGSANGYLGLTGGFSPTSGSKILLFGNETTGNIHIHSGGSTGSIKFFSGISETAEKIQILADGSFNIIPDGISTQLSVQSSGTNFYGGVILNNTQESINPSSGSLVIKGGVGILKNAYINGNLSVINSTIGILSSVNSRIGINNNNPQHTLDVSGFLNVQNGGGIFNYNSNTFGPIITTGGNVGILTTSPSTSLDINGTLRVSNSATISNLLIGNLSTGNVITNQLNMGFLSFYSGTFLAANNVSSPVTITDLQFSNSDYLNFTTTVNVEIARSTGGNLKETFYLEGYQLDAGWNMLISRYGDFSGISLSITTDGGFGRIQYTSTNQSNWISTTMRFSVTRMSISQSIVPAPISSGNFIINSLQILNTEDALPNTSSGSLYSLGGASFNKSVIINSTRVSTDISSGALVANGSGVFKKNVLINYTSGTALNVIGDANVTGVLSKGGGSFKIDHPVPSKRDTHHLVHCFVEAPTRGDNLYRFKVNVSSGYSYIQLPDYFLYLNENVQIWTSGYNNFGSSYGVLNEIKNGVDIYANIDGDYNVLIIGTRKDDLMKTFFDDKGGVEQLKK